ncbi:PfkB family carbohydrate kinase [Candidatus Ponderosibacter sp. Uisw_141_02]|uniref:PfkB family carbohydrate kinase n=1 Tax=Candidatus Ponderosibacter sp. Uisw_141_02 TaxID=3231000 RepID=UPI003D495784
MKELVLITGNFNVLHPGHQRLFRYAKTLAKKLCVAVASNKIAGPNAYYDEALRLEGIKNNVLVDDAFLMVGPVEDLIYSLTPDFVLKGSEHDGKYNPEQLALEETGGKLIFHSGMGYVDNAAPRSGFSVWKNKISLITPASYIERHGVQKKVLKGILRKIQNKKVLILGDLIIDEYVDCETLGISQEDANPVYRKINSKKYIGGAGIVACHASKIGASVTFLSLSGSDDSRKFALAELSSANVSAFIVEDQSRPTSLKKRYRIAGHSRVRISELTSQPMMSSLENIICEKILALKEKPELIIFSDFSYGFLTKRLVKFVESYADHNKIPIAADSQSSSQVGNILKFKNTILSTPTETEARMGLRNQDDGLVALSESLRKRVNARHLLLKLGAEGVLVHTKQGCTVVTDQIPALNYNVKDTSGAGDALLSISALALMVGASIWEAALLGSIGAAIQVGREGNIPIHFDEIMELV